MIDPKTYVISKHFLLSDFLGNHTVYTRGMSNMLDSRDPEIEKKLDNVFALCEYALEPIVQAFGPISVSYGYITQALSRTIVTYQDPAKPSHHMWNLGAAADICVHGWVDRDRQDDTVETAPISLAHAMDVMGIPFSRLITYSESPYLCVAVSHDEINCGITRGAFYENRYEGKSRAKPEYNQFSSPQARLRARQRMETEGLEFGWRGAGHPTYHGGGRKQFQHHRVSKYCMVSDFLMDLQSIANGAKNIPNLSNDSIWNAFCAAGEFYDYLIDTFAVKRLPIVAGFVSHTNPYFDSEKDWRSGKAYFTVYWPQAERKEMEIAALFPSFYENAQVRFPDGDYLYCEVTV